MKTLLLTNARLVLEKTVVPRGYLLVRDGRIEALGPGDGPEHTAGERRDCEGQYLLPGLIDLHVHGGGGADFMDGTTEAIVQAARAHLAHGTTTLAPTTMACPDEDLFRFMEHYREAKREKRCMPRLAGMHLEGPYFSPAQAGAQPAECLRHPCPEHYGKILDRAGDDLIRWSVAAELPGALELGGELRSRGILASIGHSNAQYEDVCRAVAHGYTHLTHFYSGMSGLTRQHGRRVMGLIECGYLMDELDIEVIADGVHVPPELLRLIFKLKPHGKISLITDSMRGAGMPDGPSVLGCRSRGVACEIRDGVAWMPDGSGYAGSVATADRLVRTAVQMGGLPLQEAVAMASLHPARLLKRDDELGSLAVGKRADLVLMNDGLETTDVYVDGNLIQLDA